MLFWLVTAYALLFQLWSGEFWGVKDCGRVQNIPEGLRVWVLPRGFAQHSDLQVNWVTFFLPTLAPWISMFCIIYLRHHQHNNPRMIVYMWSKKFKREMAVCPRDQLYPMAWRLLNNLLPGYLVACNILPPQYCSSHAKESTNSYLSLLQWVFPNKLWCWGAHRPPDHGEEVT